MNKLQKQIREKYKNLTRFAALTGVPYFKLYEMVKQDSTMVHKLIKTTKDRVLPNEIDRTLLGVIGAKLPISRDERKKFCQDHGVSNFWLQRLLSGEVVFINNRVKRLCGLLKIKL